MRLYDKLWQMHEIRKEEDGSSLLYIDRQLIHEVTSPQAFEGLRMANRKPWRVAANVAVPDHNVPTTNLEAGITDPVAKAQIETLDKNCKELGITEFAMGDIRQGVVHVMGPEVGATLPGMTIVCGDSHTSTHGALGALSFGIGTSEVEHVLATQTLVQKKSQAMLIRVDGKLNQGVTAKDLVLYIIAQIGTAGGTGYAIEFAGDAITDLSIEGRMTVCNMAIEAGARSGMIAVDDKTIEYINSRELAPKEEDWDAAVKFWKTLHSDPGAEFDRVVEIDATDINPQVTWGTSPEMGVAVDAVVPDPNDEADLTRREGMVNALKYMDLEAGQKMTDIKVDRVFIGSCTNGRIEDLRSAAKVIKDRQVADSVKEVLIVPGSGQVKKMAEDEGLDKIFIEAGCQWREPGCSMCLAMNSDRVPSGERCASTSNRNFEGRQGQGSRTHLVSPAMAAAVAVAGKFIDYRNLL